MSSHCVAAQKRLHKRGGTGIDEKGGEGVCSVCVRKHASPFPFLSVRARRGGGLTKPKLPFSDTFWSPLWLPGNGSRQNGNSLRPALAG